MWKKYGPFHTYGLKDKTSSETKVAIFDLYGTIITSKNGTADFSRIIPDNFVFLGEENIVTTFDVLLKQKTQVVILSSSDKTNLPQVKLVHQRLPKGIIYIYDSRFDISQVKSYLNMIEFLNKYIDIDRKISFYCGDQISRDDEFPPYRIGDIDTRIAQKSNLGEVIKPIDIFGSYTPSVSNKQELIVTIGNSGAGKSTMSAYLTSISKKYKMVPCDTDAMPGWDRLLTLKCIEENLSKGNSAISVATNYNLERRLELVDIAKKYNVPVRMLWFVRDGRPFNKYRGKSNKYPSTFVHKKPIPESVYKYYTSKFEDPEKDVYDYDKVTLEIVF